MSLRSGPEEGSNFQGNPNNRDIPRCIVENGVTAFLLTGWMIAHPKVTLSEIITNGIGVVARSHRALVRSLR